MQRAPLGGSGVFVSRVVHGCMAFGALDEARIVRALHAAFDAGVTSFDTAPLYDFGESETLLGKAIADRRGRVEVLTKAGLRWDGGADHGATLFEFTDGGGARRVVRKDSRPASIRAEVEASLGRLGIDAIDLLQIHHRDAGTPIAETMAALADLQRAGKIRAVGVSNFSRAEIDEAHRSLRAHGLGLAAVQMEYNLLCRAIERDVLPVARAHGIAVLAYSPLAQGVLAGRQLGADAPPEDWRRGRAYFDPAAVPAINAALRAAVGPIAAAHGASTAQICLAWLLAQPGLTAAIAGAGAPEKARDNAGAGAPGPMLDAGELRAIDAAFAPLADRPPPRAAGLGARALARARALVRRGLSR